MLGIAKIAAMAHWKRSHFDGTEVHIVALNTWAYDIIARHFTQSHPSTFSASSSSPFDLMHSRFSAGHSSHPLAELDTSSPLYTKDSLSATSVTSVFRAAASVYLHSVVSGCNPDHPNVSAAVDQAVEVLRHIPITDADRSLIWPLCVVGSMARKSLTINSYGEAHSALSSSDQRVYFTARFSSLAGKQLGNGRSAEELVKQVWRYRDMAPRGQLVDWIDVMGAHPILLA